MSTASTGGTEAAPAEGPARPQSGGASAGTSLEGSIDAVTRRFSRGSLVYGLGTSLQRGIGLLLVPIYARYLSPAELGVVGIVLAVFSGFTVIFGLGLRGAVTRQYFDHVEDPRQLREYLGSVYAFFLLFGAAGAGFLTIFGRGFFQTILAQVPFQPFVPLALWAAFFAASSGILLSLYRAREQAGRFVVVEIVSAAALAVLVVYLVAIRGGGAVGQAYALFWASVLTFALTLVLLAREARPYFNPAMIRSAVSFGAPLTLHLLASWALLAADRILLERTVPLSEVGLYTLGYQLAMVAGIVASASNAAWTPIFYDIAPRGQDSGRVLGRLATVNIALGFGASLLVILYGREAVALIAGPEYASAATVVPVIALGYAFQSLYFVSVTPIFFTRKTRVLPLLTGAAAALNVALNLVLIPPYGMIGAAWATVAAFAFLFVATFLAARTQFAVMYETPTIALLGALIAAGAFLAWWTADLSLLAATPLKLLLVAGFVAACARARLLSRLRGTADS